MSRRRFCRRSITYLRAKPKAPRYPARADVVPQAERTVQTPRRQNKIGRLSWQSKESHRMFAQTRRRNPALLAAESRQCERTVRILVLLTVGLLPRVESIVRGTPRSETFAVTRRVDLSSATAKPDAGSRHSNPLMRPRLF